MFVICLFIDRYNNKAGIAVSKKDTVVPAYLVSYAPLFVIIKYNMTRDEIILDPIKTICLYSLDTNLKI